MNTAPHNWKPPQTKTAQELLVEGPLTNLKPSLAQLPAPKRRFDRAAFGIDSASGLGGLGAVGRFHPTERVGDPTPAAHPPHGDGGGAAAASSAAAAAAGLGGGDAGARPGFAPFVAPPYAIPAGPGVIGDGGKPRRSGGGATGGSGLGSGGISGLGIGGGASQSQAGLGLGLATQQFDMGGSAGATFSLGGLGAAFGTQDFGAAATQLGGASQASYLGLSQAPGGGGYGGDLGGAQGRPR